MSEPKFQRHQHVRIKSGNRKIPRHLWGKLAIVVDREHIIVRALFRTDYQVIMADTYKTMTFKEDDLE